MRWLLGSLKSGESTDVNSVLDNSRKGGAVTGAITNDSQSTMAEIADETFLIHAGRERSVAATKTYTGQLMIFHLLASALDGDRRIAEVERLPEIAARFLDLRPRVEESRFIAVSSPH